MIDQAGNVKAWRELHDAGYFEQREQYRTYEMETKIPPMIEVLLPVTRAIDIGCGYGRFMAPLVDWVEELIGIDIHPVPTEMGKKLLGSYRGVRFILTDGQTIPFPDESVDLVYSVSAFQHMPVEGVRRYIEEIARVLRPRGSCAIQFLHGPLPGRTAQDFAGGEDSIAWDMNDAMLAFNAAGIATSATLSSADTGTSLWVSGLK